MSPQSGPPTRTAEPRRARPGTASLRVMAYPDLFLVSLEDRAAGGSPIFVERLSRPPYISPSRSPVAVLSNSFRTRSDEKRACVIEPSRSGAALLPSALPHASMLAGSRPDPLTLHGTHLLPRRSGQSLRWRLLSRSG